MTALRRAHLFVAVLAGLASIGLGRVASQSPEYEVYAIRFASVPFKVSQLVAGADPSRSIDIAFTIWAAKGGGRVLLLDAGFYRDKFIQQWKPVDFTRPSAALTAGLGIRPEDVTDIVISHSHWDHTDGVDLFPKATVWIQREEYQYYVGPQGEVLHTGGVDSDDAKMLLGLFNAGRLKFVDGDAKTILPGIVAYTGGKHTYASQYLGIHTRSGVVVLASDNAYLYENIEQHRAIAQTLDAAANVEAGRRMTSLAASPALVIPGHDPAVFTRFPTIAPGVVRID
jgi:glyoxylase-like metal-dependent hydrolase (beta-lactamase superfamily II)